VTDLAISTAAGEKSVSMMAPSLSNEAGVAPTFRACPEQSECAGIFLV